MAAPKKKPDQGDSSESNSGDVAGTGPVEQQAKPDEAGAMREAPDPVNSDSRNSDAYSRFVRMGRESGREESLLPGMDLAEALGLHSNLEASTPGNGTGVNSQTDGHELLDRLLTAMVLDRTMDTLADDLADRLRYGLARSPQIRRRLIDAVMSNEAARARFIKTLVKSFV